MSQKYTIMAVVLVLGICLTVVYYVYGTTDSTGYSVTSTCYTWSSWTECQMDEHNCSQGTSSRFMLCTSEKESRQCYFDQCYTSFGCDWKENIVLSCPHGKVIKILSTYTGTYDFLHMQESNCVQFTKTYGKPKPCNGVTLTEYTYLFKMICENDNRCEFYLVANVPAKECHKNKKYAEINYTCVDPVPLPKYTLDLSVGMIFVESRLIPTTDGAIKSVLLNTPTEWPLYIYHGGGEHEDFMRNLSFNEVIKKQNRPALWKIIPEKYRAQSQNVLAKDPEFWQSFNEDVLLQFHADSAMCYHPPSQKPKYSLEFLMSNFDFVGAPWEVVGRGYKDKPVMVGNGGFTIRNKHFMLKCLSDDPDGLPEDYYYALCASLGGRFCPEGIASHWAFEIGHPPPISWGIHSPCDNQRPRTCNQTYVTDIVKYCPGIEFFFTNGTCHNCPAANSTNAKK